MASRLCKIRALAAAGQLVPTARLGALGAERLLSALDGEEYNQFAERAYKAISNTLEADRLAAFDAKSGLYTGEQSFLDWREQTYSTWTPNDVNAIGSSKALSTNVVHYRAIQLAAKLAEKYDSTNASNTPSGLHS